MEKRRELEKNNCAILTVLRRLRSGQVASRRIHRRIGASTAKIVEEEQAQDEDAGVESVGAGDSRAAQVASETSPAVVSEIKKRHSFEASDVHVLDVTAACESLGTSMINGLTTAEVERRLVSDGPNVLAPPKRPSVIVRIIVVMVTAGFAPLLWIAAGLAFAIYPPPLSVPAQPANLDLGVVLVFVILVSGTQVVISCDLGPLDQHDDCG